MGVPTTQGVEEILPWQSAATFLGLACFSKVLVIVIAKDRCLHNPTHICLHQILDDLGKNESQ